MPHASRPRRFGLLASGLGLLCAAATACAPAAAAVAQAGDAGDAGATIPASPRGEARAALIARLTRLNRGEAFLFGEENATIWGMALDSEVVSTSKWFEATARAGRFTSDSAMLVGDDPAVLGVSLGMLAFEPVAWNRRPVIAAAIRRQIAAGGVVTMDWHAPSCNADARSAGALATVEVDGRPVVIHALTSGASFYAEEEYRHALASRADLPATLACLCQIANDLPLWAGPYKGISGRTWLVAQAKHAARVMRDERLAGLPIIVRPFHEQSGAWFWWGRPYWNCAALLDKPDAVSGPDAYKTMLRTFIAALRAEPGMGELVFAYSPDKVLGRGEEAEASAARERLPAAERKIDDPMGWARDRLRERLVRELEAAKLAYVSPRAAAAKTRPADIVSARGAAAYVAERRPIYAEAYAGDDVFDLLGIDLYYPGARPATREDLRLFDTQLRIVAEEARARGKAYALTEVGTYRLDLLARVARAAPRAPVPVHARQEVDDARARLFDPADRAALLRHFALAAPGAVALSGAERARAVPRLPEGWYTTQLLPLAKQAKVAYALVWQTYYDARLEDRYAYYYVPYPSHPEAPAFIRFHADPATCFLRDGCALAEPRSP